MPVYVDDAKNEYKHPKYGLMKMSHMVGDTLDELHAMARKIGASRSWFQNNPNHPHYDVNQRLRIAAVQNGAIEITQRQLVEFFRKKKVDNQ